MSETQHQTGAFQHIEPHAKDIGGGVHIHRYLPQMQRQAIGPFVFFDHMPQLEFAAGTGMDVRPHPHIGLSTLSYLLEGRVHHRDSLGCDVILSPGNVLLMTSGRGIVHSERTPAEDRSQAHQLHMLQFWLALPQANEQDEPSVSQATAAELPAMELRPGLHARVVIGEYAGLSSPVQRVDQPLLLELRADLAGEWHFGSADAELGLFLLSGQLIADGHSYQGPCLLSLPRSENLAVRYTAQTRFIVFGGQPLDGKRTLWWNLVASDPALIEAAKQRWRQGEFPRVPGDETEFISLPEEDEGLRD